MHGRLSLFESIRSREDNERNAGTAFSRQGFRNLLGPPTPGNGPAENDETRRRRLLGLSTQIMRGLNDFWTDPVRLPSDPTRPSPPKYQSWENPAIPSGYTYLLQLIAHDLIASSVSLAVGDARAVVENTRDKALLLDCLYGAGPDLSPHVYEFSTEYRDTKGITPRTHLRVGPQRKTSASGSVCPMRDIARGRATEADDSGLDTPQKREKRTIAMLADPRNDMHALISQFVVLFHSLHNTIVGKLEKRTQEGSVWKPVDLAYRHYLCARLVVTMIYRNIIKRDVLKRILHPDVYRAYDSGFLLEPEIDKDESAIALEFSYAAFRFGHSMIRASYRVNSPTSQNTTDALKQTSTGWPVAAPIDDGWLVDWRYFFDIDPTIIPNSSRRMGPSYASVLNGENFAVSGERNAPGVAYRDLLGSSYAGLWSARGLIEKLRNRSVSQDLAALVPPYEVWIEPLKTWLGEGGNAPWLPSPLSPEDAAAIAENPPLSFFVLFEAAHTLSDGTPTRDGGGCKLGVLGSMIVAETMFGALTRDKIANFEEPNLLRDRIRRCCAGILEDEHALDDVGVAAAADTFRDIETMSDLLSFMTANECFSNTVPQH